MPEGPEMRRAADRIERAIAGRKTTGVELAFPRLARYCKRLTGVSVLGVETRGKALIVHFEGGWSIYTHSQLYGVWKVALAGRLPKTKRSLRLAIHNAERSALLYSASEIEVWPRAKLDAHPFLAKLGPDALASGLGDADLLRQVSAPRFSRRQLRSLLLDQGFVAGVGNYLRSEILFVAGLHPDRRPGELDPAELHRLVRAIRRVTRRSYRSGGITNDAARVRDLKQQGLPRSEYRHHVFGRAGRPCWSCGGRIVRETTGGRQLFRCPRCQPATAIRA